MLMMIVMVMMLTINADDDSELIGKTMVRFGRENLQSKNVTYFRHQDESDIFSYRSSNNWIPFSDLMVNCP